MAGEYQRAWEEQKKKNPYLTLSNAGTAAKPKPGGANVVSAASADLGAGKTAKPSGANTVSMASANLGAGRTNRAQKKTANTSASTNAYKALLNTQNNPNLTFKAPTVQAAVKGAVSGIGAGIAADAYKKRLAARNRVARRIDDDKPVMKARKLLSADDMALRDKWVDDAVLLYNPKLTKDNYAVRAGEKNPTTGGGLRTYGANDVSLMSANLDQNLAEREARAEAERQAAYKAAEPYSNYNQYMLPEGYALYNTGAVDGSRSAIDNYNRNMTLTGQALLDEAAFNAAVEAQKKQIEEERTAGAYQNQIATQQPVQENNLEEYLAEMEAYWQDVLEAEQAKYDALLGSILGQKGALNAQYDAQAADLYELYRRSMLAYPEMMSGTATGIADSLTLQNDLNFQNNLADNELARAAALEALQTQANQIQADADLQAAQTAQEWAQMAYKQRVANQSSGSGTKTSKGDDDGYDINTIEEAKQYLELQLGMGNNMSRDNIISLLKDMYNAGAISKTLAQDTAAKFGIGLYL